MYCGELNGIGHEWHGRMFSEISVKTLCPHDANAIEKNWIIQVRFGMLFAARPIEK
jgi:hypothetical protein